MDITTDGRITTASASRASRAASKRCLLRMNSPSRSSPSADICTKRMPRARQASEASASGIAWWMRSKSPRRRSRRMPAALTTASTPSRRASPGFRRERPTEVERQHLEPGARRQCRACGSRRRRHALGKQRFDDGAADKPAPPVTRILIAAPVCVASHCACSVRIGHCAGGNPRQRRPDRHPPIGPELAFRSPSSRGASPRRARAPRAT